MRHNIGQGILWTGAEKIFVNAINFVQGVILARLLSPNDFGLTAMLGIFLAVGATLAESGFGTALVADKGKYACHERRALKWNIAFASVLYIILFFTAPFIADWYRISLLSPLMRVMALGLIINATSVVATARLMREMRFKELAFVNSVPTIVGATIALILAWYGFGVWSIVIMGLVTAAVRTILAWTIGGYSARRDCSTTSHYVEHRTSNNEPSTSFRSFLTLGAKLSASSLIFTIYTNLYQLVIGKFFNPAAVGLFSRAQRWSQLPCDLANQSIGRVAFAEFANGKSRFSRFISLNAVLLLPALAILWIFATEIVGFVLGTKWLDCVPALKILIIGSAFTVVSNTAMQYISASGKGEYNLYCDFVKRPLGLIFLAIGTTYGIKGLCWSCVANEVVTAATNLAFALRIRSRLAAERPVDLVYTWYNKDVPPEGTDKCRHCDNGELYWSIKSVDRFAPWFRNIYIFVNDGTVIPKWLLSHPKVRIVEHHEIIPTDILPLYNSVAIEFWIHRLPGLSEHFVYSNDDMFIGNVVSKHDFFTDDGKIKYMVTGYPLIKNQLSTSYEDMLFNNRHLLKASFATKTHHNMDAYTKSCIATFWDAYPEQSLYSASCRYRSSDQLIREVFALYALKKHKAVRRVVDRKVRLKRLLGIPPYISMCAGIQDKITMDWIMAERPKFFCLNDNELATDADRDKLKKFLEEYYRDGGESTTL